MRPGTYSLTLTLMYMLCTHLKEREQKRGKGEQNGKHVAVCSRKPQICYRLYNKNKERAITLSLITLLSFHIV